MARSAGGQGRGRVERDFAEPGLGAGDLAVIGGRDSAPPPGSAARASWGFFSASAARPCQYRPRASEIGFSAPSVTFLKCAAAVVGSLRIAQRDPAGGELMVGAVIVAARRRGVARHDDRPSWDRPRRAACAPAGGARSTIRRDRGCRRAAGRSASARPLRRPCRRGAASGCGRTCSRCRCARRPARRRPASCRRPCRAWRCAPWRSPARGRRAGWRRAAPPSVSSFSYSRRSIRALWSARVRNSPNCSSTCSFDLLREARRCARPRAPAPRRPCGRLARAARGPARACPWR